MRDFLHDPAWRREDLGLALPDSPHAVSVAMPLWEHVVGYEEEDPEVVARLQCGYPRFFCHPTVRRLFAEAEARCAEAGERAVVLPTAAAAVRCVRFLADRHGIGSGVRVVPFGEGTLAAVVTPEDAFPRTLEYWRYSGEIVSSRMGEAALAGRVGDGVEGDGDRAAVRERIAALAGQEAGDVYLFGTGMAATFTAHRMVSALKPEGRSLQLEFPYVDVLKVQSHFGAGERFYPVVRPGDWDDIRARLADEPLAGVFCELASNPLMRSVDLETLAPAMRAHDVPLVIDDTVATVVNADVYRFADVVTTSLTKYFAGRGDVMGGALVVRKDSPYAEVFRSWLGRDGNADGAPLWAGDAAAVEEGSRDFEARMGVINASAEALVAFLRGHPAVRHVYFPDSETPGLYEQIRRPGGGYGGLLSLVLHDASTCAPAFYDRLEVSKGPSFGTRFTLACPYTLLAHYGELDWAERCGVSRWLVRVGVGAEDEADLLGRFEKALC